MTILFYGCYSFLVSLIVILLYTTITSQISIDNIPWPAIVANTKMPMGIAFIFMAIFTARSWLLEWRNAAIEAEQLKSEKLTSQNQSLKDQLNPHFLFNSLNALSNLVYESPDRSAAFIQQLSRIYRYVLDVQQEELVSLKRELDFAENYLSLQKIRFEESLSFEIEVNNPDGFFLPPLSLQLLMENAIKHNIVSMEHPLKISINQQEEVLIICNNLQPKRLAESDSNGIGLANIEKRYQLLSDLPPKISKTASEFCVELPLLKISK